MAEPVTAAANSWFPVLTLVLGVVLGQVGEWLKDGRAHKREKEARDTARRDSLAEQRNAFQRQTLLELQDALIVLMQSAGALHLQKMSSFRQHGRSRSEDIRQETNIANRDANSKTAILGVRVRDDEVRGLLKTLKAQLSAEAMTRDPEEAEDAINIAAQVFAALNDRIGLVLRALEDLELKRERS
jgi:hypothetical protein